MLPVLFYVNAVRSQCACCASTSGFSAAGSSPSVFNLKKNQVLVEAYADYRMYRGLQVPANYEGVLPDSAFLRIRNAGTGILGVRYGISNRLNLVIQQPYFSIHANTMSSQTFGDLTTVLSAVVLKRPGSALSLQAGLEWPVGKATVTGANTIITGSGSYDPIMGMTYSRLFGRSMLNAAAYFKYTTKGFNNTWFGNSFSHQLGYNYNLLSPSDCSADSLAQKPALFLSLQCSGEWMQPQMKDHALVANTGGYAVLASCGMVFSFRGFSVPLLLSLPVYRYLHGIQNTEALRIRIGITRTFN